MKTIQVNLPKSSFAYKVAIGSNVLEESLSEVLAKYGEPLVYVITNETVRKLYPDFPDNSLPDFIKCEYLVLPDGEQYKNLETLSKIYDFLVEKKANRKSVLIAFGGGVIGDMTGFAAATFMRGTPFIQIPTTLLSQVDSGIGGKTGINHRAGKNFIGAFKQPLKTIIDVEFLNTLPDREFIAGYAELIKHGIIRDPYLFQILSRHEPQELTQNKELLVESVFRSCEVKARVVEADEKESNQRAILNFGHTIGHFLETLTHYRQMLHGEAVIIGMDYATWWSYQMGQIKKEDYQLVHDHLAKLKVQHKLPSFQREDFISIVQRDKKSAARGIRFVGLNAIGNAMIFEDTKAEDLWEHFQSFLQTDTFVTVDT